MNERALAKPLYSLSDQRHYLLQCREHVLKHHVVRMQGRAYVTVAGATQIAALMGFTCQEVSCEFKPACEGLAAHWLGTVEVLNTATGQVIGRGSAICSTEEKRWSKADAFAQRSMAVTRAAGKALRLCLGHVFSMLGDGVQATTAEEMPAELHPAAPQQEQREEGPRIVLGTVYEVSEHKAAKSGKRYWRVRCSINGHERTLTAFKNVGDTPPGDYELVLTNNDKGDEFIDAIYVVPEGDM